jgi:hypothetical protein
MECRGKGVCIMKQPYDTPELYCTVLESAELMTGSEDDGSFPSDWSNFLPSSDSAFMG